MFRFCKAVILPSSRGIDPADKWRPRDGTAGGGWGERLSLRLQEYRRRTFSPDRIWFSSSSIVPRNWKARVLDMIRIYLPTITEQIPPSHGQYPRLNLSRMHLHTCKRHRSVYSDTCLDSARRSFFPAHAVSILRTSGVREMEQQDFHNAMILNRNIDEHFSLTYVVIGTNLDYDATCSSE